MGAKCLIHDRDTKYTRSFDQTLASAGIKPIRLPARSPNLNPYAERWVLSLKSEVLDHLILPGERQLRRVLNEYLAHYRAERAHQGLSGGIIDPEEVSANGNVVRRKCFGGLPSCCLRRAA